jgi:MFS superfamily sulfate permease-like transporter
MLVAGLFGGSHHNIVGPAGSYLIRSESAAYKNQLCFVSGALTGILSKNSIRYGVDVLPLLSIITGTLCIGVFLLQLDQCVQFVPLSVVQGFSLGVSFSIAANQLDFALGLPRYCDFL